MEYGVAAAPAPSGKDGRFWRGHWEGAKGAHQSLRRVHPRERQVAEKTGRARTGGGVAAGRGPAAAVSAPAAGEVAYRDERAASTRSEVRTAGVCGWAKNVACKFQQEGMGAMRLFTLQAPNVTCTERMIPQEPWASFAFFRLSRGQVFREQGNTRTRHHR
jgi:hypothetical protein